VVRDQRHADVAVVHVREIDRQGDPGPRGVMPEAVQNRSIRAGVTFDGSPTYAHRTLLMYVRAAC